MFAFRTNGELGPIRRSAGTLACNATVFWRQASGTSGWEPVFRTFEYGNSTRKTKKAYGVGDRSRAGQDEVEELLDAAALEDEAGLAPLHEEWTPTYDLNAAAAAGWLLKAGRASSTTETEPESFYVTSKVFDNCCRMAHIYRSKGRTSVSVASPPIESNTI